MINLIVFGIALYATYLVIKFITQDVAIRRQVVFAGSPADEANTEVIPVPKNTPVYRIGEQEVDVSGLAQLSIRGKSLNPLDIKDGATVFVRVLHDADLKELDLHKWIGRFVVFKIDNERTLREYPLKNLSIVDGALKIRKVIRIVATKLEREVVKEDIGKFLESNDMDYQRLNSEEAKKEVIDRIITKYEFASSYYANDERLIMSITYKNNGTCKDYSFHSPGFLYGIVEYNSL